MSYELVLRVLVQWAEQKEEPILWDEKIGVNKRTSHPRERILSTWKRRYYPSRTFLNMAHVSRWFHMRLSQTYESDFTFWLQYADSGFVDACLQCTDLHWSRLHALYGPDARSSFGDEFSPDCEFHNAQQELDWAEDELEMKRGYTDYDYVEFAEVSQSIAVNKSIIQTTSCTCADMFNWRKQDLKTVVDMCYDAIDYLEEKEPHISVAFIGGSLVLQEDEDDGCELEYAEELACRLLSA